MNRAYAVLEVKSVDEDKRIITRHRHHADAGSGRRYRRAARRQVQESAAAAVAAQSDKPVGSVTFDKPTKDGIKFEASCRSSTSPAR
jgi:hypothetical protein